MNEPFETRTETGNSRAGVVIPLLGSARFPSDGRVEETAGLVDALGCECCFVSPERVREPNAAILFGSGSLAEIERALDEADAELLVVDGVLTPIQQRNLERKLGRKVIDRTGLILEIFGLRAKSRAGQLQVETARLAYERSRLVRTWTHLERQRGGGGFLSGPGETQIESDRRMIDERLIRLKRQLKDVDKTRRLHRSGRSKRGVPIIALVGYTNAGKSTLFNKLADADAFAKDMPFATLDPSFRKIDLPRRGEAALVDTVGFITDLPTQLIESFKSTLDEALHADLLLHVRDVASDDTQSQKADVEEILEALSLSSGIPLPPVIEVWNKFDKLDADQKQNLVDRELTQPDKPSIAISALKNYGLTALVDLIDSELGRNSETFTLRIPPEGGRAIAWLHEHGDVLRSTSDKATGQTILTVALDHISAARLLADFPDLVLDTVPAA